MTDKWFKAVCNKCGKEFNGQYKEGTSVFCNKCALWVYVGEDVVNEPKKS